MNILSSSLLSTILLISAGASSGATLRWIISSNLNQLHEKIALGTLASNLLGGLLIGFFYEYSEAAGLSDKHKILIITGFLGSLTTFSSFTLEAYQLFQKGEQAWALAHSLFHFLGSVVFLLLGVFLVRAFS